MWRPGRTSAEGGAPARNEVEGTLLQKLVVRSTAGVVYYKHNGVVVAKANNPNPIYPLNGYVWSYKSGSEDWLFDRDVKVVNCTFEDPCPPDSSYNVSGIHGIRMGGANCPLCPHIGNDVIDPGEACDDGNMQSCDGCSSLGQTETLTTYYYDFDQDGYGTPDGYMQSYSSPAAAQSYFTTVTGDCNEYNAAIHLGATELCGDGVDQDCNGSDSTCGGGGTTDLYPAADSYTRGGSYANKNYGISSALQAKKRYRQQPSHRVPEVRLVRYQRQRGEGDSDTLSLLWCELCQDGGGQPNGPWQMAWSQGDHWGVPYGENSHESGSNIDHIFLNFGGPDPASSLPARAREDMVIGTGRCTWTTATCVWTPCTKALVSSSH